MKAIVFDVDDTLYDQMVPFSKAVDAVIGPNKLNSLRLFNASRYHSDVAFEQMTRGEMSLEQSHIQRITNTMKEFGIVISPTQARAFQTAYAKFQEQIEISPQMAKLLDGISQVKKNTPLELGIITNGPDQHQANKIKQLDLQRWFKPEHVLISGQVGIAKPDQQIFRLMESRLNLPATELVMVGDSYQNDIVGALTSGWQAIWFNHRQRPLERGGAKPEYLLAQANIADLESIILKLVGGNYD